MAVENNKVDETFAMNGTLLVFSVTGMRVIDRATVKAYVIDNTVPATPVRTDLILDDAGVDGYSVALVTPNSVNVTVVDDRDANFELVVYRELALLQDSDYTDYGKFPAETVEDDFDEGILIDQQIEDKANRSIKVDIDIDLDAINVTLPSPIVADSVIGWNAAGTALEYTAGLAASVAAAAASAAAALVSENNAATSEANASTSETNAGTSETNAAASAAAALVSENNASTSETNAAASEAAAALSAAQLIGTSVTSRTVGTLGSFGFVTQAGKFFDTGTNLLITSDSAPSTEWMSGQVTAYAGTALTVDIEKFEGSGTHTDWTIRVSGSPGVDGASGTTFVSLSDTPANFAGATLQSVRVNAGETALEFFTPAASGGGGGKVFSTALMGG